jgi:hypothetical protein
MLLFPSATSAREIGPQTMHLLLRSGIAPPCFRRRVQIVYGPFKMLFCSLYPVLRMCFVHIIFDSSNLSGIRRSPLMWIYTRKRQRQGRLDCRALMRAAEGSNRFAQRVKYPRPGVAIRQARELQREGLNVYCVMGVEMKRASKGRNDPSRGDLRQCGWHHFWLVCSDR